MRAPIEPAGERLGDAERPAALLAAAQHRLLHRLVVDREHELAEDRAQLASSASISAMASSSVGALAVMRT